MRFGIADGRWLVYVKGGFAHGSDRHGQNQVSTVVGLPMPQFVSVAGTGSRLGSMVGLGAEYGFLGNWSAKVEYNYVDLSLDPRVFETGTQTDFFGVTTNISTTQVVYERFHIVKAGLNYRLGAVGGPETAPTAPASGYHWTGLYVGAQAAGDWAHAYWIRLAPQNEYAISGWLGGAVVGVNAQAGA